MSQVITIDDLQSYMVGKTLDPGLGQQVVDAMNGWVETRTGRVWGETKQVTERYDWTRNLWLRHQDVVTVDSITVGWPGKTQTTLDATGYFVNEFGRITLLWQFQNFGGNHTGSPLLNDYMGVTYTYGVTTVPDDLFLAVLGIAAGFYNFSINGQQNVVAASVGSYHLEYSGAIRGSGGIADAAKSTQDANWQIVDSYRLRRS